MSLSRPLLSGFSQSLLVIGYAVIVSIVISREKWLYSVAIAVIPFVLLWPVEMSLGIFAMLIPFDSIFAFGGGAGPGSTLNWYLGATAGLVLLGTGLLTKRLRLPPRAALWWGLLMLWGAATVLWALDPQMALGRLPTASAVFLLYLAAVSLRIYKEELSRISLFVIVGGVAGALYASFQFEHGIGVGERASLLVDTRATNPNEFAASLILPLALAIGGFLSCRNYFRKAAWMAAVGVIGVGLCLSMSRGALIALLIMMLAYLCRCPSSFRILLAVAALSATLVVALPALSTRVNNSLSSRGEGRFDIWQVGSVAMRHYGIVGAGLDNFPRAYDKYVRTRSATVFRGYNRQPHNLFLGIAVELGLVGFVMLIGALQSQLRAALAIKTAAEGAPCSATVAYEAGCCGMLAMGLSLDNLWLKAFWISWILLAIAVRVNQPGEELAARSGVICQSPTLHSAFLPVSANRAKEPNRYDRQ